MRILTGIQPSGELHIGNYFGAIKPCVQMQDQGQTFLFIADYHALTQQPDPQALRDRVRGIVIDWLACGIDPSKTIFYRQSDVPEVTELTWLLCCLTPKGLLERCHSYKDKIAQGLTPNHGLFTYPVLMAADILLYDANVVPVGRDQKQHLEVTRDIAIRFNNLYGEVLTIPEAMIRDEVAIVPGLDGRKMSKSYDNTIPLFGAEKPIWKKKFGRIVTDSTPMEDPKEPDNCNVFKIFSLFGNEEEKAELAAKYRGGNFGYGHAKKAAFDAYREYFRPYRERREELLADPAHVDAVLADGAARAREIAQANMARIKEAVGLR
jgi:tryptophanyl-tRNA synthetase